MSVWDRLVCRTWKQVAARYPTFGDAVGLRWYSIMYGYQYALPVIGTVQSTFCRVGMDFTLEVEVTEQLEALDGPEIIPTGDVFTGAVTAEFLGIEYPMTYSESTGRFHAVLQAPVLEEWSEDNPSFPGVITAVNDRGETAASFRITAYRTIPVITGTETNDCAAGGEFVLRVTVGVGTVPAGGDATGIEFVGTVAARFFSQDYELTQGADRGWAASLPAPPSTSWHLENHVFTGEVTASTTSDSVTSAFYVRVREEIPPAIYPEAPSQDSFICNDCSPQFRWTVTDEASGVDYVEVSLDGGPYRAAELSRFTACWQMPVVLAGEHTVVVKAVDHDGNVSEQSRTVTGIEMVTDRSQADVADVQRLAALSWRAMTPGEQTRWLYGLKGAYNTVDLNRVEWAAGYLARRLTEHKIPLVPDIKTDWAFPNLPDSGGMTRYLGNAAAIAESYGPLKAKTADYYGAFPDALEGLPDSMDNLTYDGANRIEKALAEVEKLLNWKETYDWYITSHARTWGEVGAYYGTWGGAAGRTWAQAAVLDEIIESELTPPWNVMA